MSWSVASTLLVVLALAIGFAWYERSRPSSKVVALVAALAAAAVAGRVLFTAVPNVQGTTDVVLLSGYAVGAAPGFVVGALAALASNFFLGQGPWTPWQMLGWGGVGLAGAGLARLLPPRALAGRARRVALAAACALAGLLFGAWMDLFTLLTFSGVQSREGYIAIAGTSLPFNLAHAVGNALLCIAFGPAFVRQLLRFRRRFHVRWSRVPDTRAAVGALSVALAVAVAVPLLGPPPAAGASAVSAGARYLERAQNRDGGFGSAPGERSSDLMTGWASLGLEAGGRNPRDVRRGGRTPIDYVRGRARSLGDVGEVERTILVARGAGVSPRSIGGQDLLARLLDAVAPDGSIERRVNHTAFGILAMRAASRSARSRAVRRAAAWLASQQNTDGGFPFASRGGASDVDDTGAALQALAAGRHAPRRLVSAAVRFLRAAHNADGGLGQMPGSRSNAQSTAWAIQGLVAVRREPSRLDGGRSPVAYLRSLQQSNGSFRYSRTSAQTPVWVTAQATAALARRPFPLRPVPRKRAARAHNSKTGKRAPTRKGEAVAAPGGAAGGPASGGGELPRASANGSPAAPDARISAAAGAPPGPRAEPYLPRGQARLDADGERSDRRSVSFSTAAAAVGAVLLAGAAGLGARRLRDRQLRRFHANEG
jgi:energy-coupling factor transport system substrate-specific component